MPRSASCLALGLALDLGLAACSVTDPGLVPDATVKAALEPPAAGPTLVETRTKDQAAAADILARIQQFAPAVLSVDLSALPSPSAPRSTS